MLSILQSAHQFVEIFEELLRNWAQVAMVVRLRTVDGKIKLYETYRGEGGGENGPPDKYVTKCGMEWKRMPRPYETCDHIDCALDVQRGAADIGPIGFLFFLVCAAIIPFFSMKDVGIWSLALSGFCILFGVWILINGIKAEDRFKELTEYKRKGTINGIRAYAVPAFEELAELTDAKECVDIGLAFHDNGRYGDAIKAFDRAIVLNPASVAAWKGKGITLKAQRKYDEAIAAYDKATELDPQLADAWYDKGMALAIKNKYDEAIISYNNSLNIKLKFKEAWYNKGLALCKKGKYDEAIQAYDKAIKIDRKNADVWYSKGIALKLLGRTAEADETFDRAKKEWNSEGMDLIYLEKYVEAIKALDMALVVDPKYENALINKGTACFRLGRYEEAMAAFDQVIEFDPRNADAWNRKGIVLKKVGRNLDANDAFAKARDLGYTG